MTRAKKRQTMRQESLQSDVLERSTRLKIGLKWQYFTKFTFKTKQLTSIRVSFLLKDTVDSKSTTGAVYTQANDEAVRDFSSRIWQKTAIAAVTENNATNNKEAASISSKSEEVGTCKTQQYKTTDTRLTPLQCSLIYIFQYQYNSVLIGR